MPRRRSLEVELGAVEGPPLALGDDEIARLGTQLGDDLVPVGRTGPRLPPQRVGLGAQRILAVRRRGDTDQDDQAAERPERTGDSRRARHHVRRRMRGGWHSHGAPLQVDHQERRARRHEGQVHVLFSASGLLEGPLRLEAS